MGLLYEPTKKELASWKRWVRALPAIPRAVAEEFEPWRLYRLASSGHRVTIRSYADDGTLTVSVTGEFNLVSFERDVFGISPSDLTECDLPSPGETLGSAMTPDQVHENIDAIRAATRPDLWVLDDAGKAVRRQ